MGNHCCIIGCLDQGSLAYTNGNNCIANGDPNEMIDGSGSGGTTMNQMDQTTNQRCIRPFTISRISSIQLPADSRLYRDQTLLKTDNGLDIVKKHISLNSLQSFIQNELSTDLVIRTTIDHSNIETNKVIQNFYITSFGGLSLKTLKTNHINLLLNATIDLPIVDFPKIMNNSINNNNNNDQQQQQQPRQKQKQKQKKHRQQQQQQQLQQQSQQQLMMETLRIPISTKEPRTLKLYMNDVADKIHENYLKNGNTLIYCYDGSLNSVVLAIGYLIKYTDLWLSEAILHMKYTRKGFETRAANDCGNELGTFKKIIYKFAQKHGKNDLLDLSITKSTTF
ncbi:uncharacterized protein LOC124497592 [Dermatophagoides farinae]|uniref:Dual specificity protein phosphatase 14 n=1 Tax=Dermatophagoides farinae TaxID=6954 RepID=A0A922HV69_DERFA|nr:map kinase phosphatase-like protein [Dermatophagoides farinae]KAH9506834.1 Dual specificity protein phosphatase 14 [Dermatophagoides farinae]